MSGAKLVSRDKEIPLTSDVSSVFIICVFIDIHIPMTSFPLDALCGALVHVLFLLPLVPDPTSYFMCFLDPQLLSTFPFL